MGGYFIAPQFERRLRFKKEATKKVLPSMKIVAHREWRKNVEGTNIKECKRLLEVANLTLEDPVRDGW